MAVSGDDVQGDCGVGLFRILCPIWAADGTPSSVTYGTFGDSCRFWKQGGYRTGFVFMRRRLIFCCRRMKNVWRFDKRTVSDE